MNASILSVLIWYWFVLPFIFSCIKYSWNQFGHFVMCIFYSVHVESKFKKTIAYCVVRRERHIVNSNTEAPWLIPSNPNEISWFNWRNTVLYLKHMVTQLSLEKNICWIFWCPYLTFRVLLILDLGLLMQFKYDFLLAKTNHFFNIRMPEQQIFIEQDYEY